MTEETTTKLKFGAWGIAAGAVVAMVIGFTWGGWVTGGTADEQTDEAVLATRSAICVAQFMNAPDHAEQLKKFKEIDSWKRREFVQEGNWATMPGDESAVSSVARACANGIAATIQE